MHDYDVGAISLSVPPASAVLQSYRPAVLVRNNGVHDALASGTLRIYSPAGLLIFTTEIYSGTISPGATEPAQAVDYWTPPAIGRYQVIAYVSCPLDQYEPNNSLAPRFVDVTGAPPPPEPTVPLHASQHEEGGSDEVDIDGLRGRAADPQTALAHKTSHQTAGSDELDLTGMGGILRDGQPIADHHLTHEHGGGDRLYVGGLNGQLADSQPALIHDNAKHNPNYATVTEFNNHLADTTAVHAVATNLEQTANKGEPDGYPELDEYGHIPPQQLAVWTTPPPANDKALLPDQTFGYPLPAEHSATEHDDTVEATANKGEPSGYAGLDNVGHVPDSQLANVPDPPPDASDALTLGSGWAPANAIAHALKHELGGIDEISIAGLLGKAADAQDPVGHHVSHEPGGSDPVSGVPSVPTPHAESHENGGDDELSIAGLAGLTADPQRPLFRSAACNDSEIPGTDPETVLVSRTFPIAWCHDHAAIRIHAFGYVHVVEGPYRELHFRLYVKRADLADNCIADIAINGIHTTVVDRAWSIFGSWFTQPVPPWPIGYGGHLALLAYLDEMDRNIWQDGSNQQPFNTTADITVELRCVWIGGTPEDHVHVQAALLHSTTSLE